MKRLVWLLSILLLVPSVSGCTCEARFHLEPSTLTLRVGGTAPPPRASVSGCNSPKRTIAIETWTSENPEIASVDSDTGVITGVAPGETTIDVIAVEPESFYGTLSITVLPSTTAAR